MTLEELRVSVVAELEGTNMSVAFKEIIELSKKEPIREFNFTNSDTRELYTVLLKTSNEMVNWFKFDVGDFLLASSRVIGLLRTIGAFNNKPKELHSDYSRRYNQSYFRGCLGRFSVFEFDEEEGNYVVIGNQSKYLYIKVNNLK